MERLRWLKDHKFEYNGFHNDRIPGNFYRTFLSCNTHVMHIVKGSGSIIVEKKKYHFKPGDILAFPSNTIHAVEVKNDSEMLSFYCRILLKNGDLMEVKARLPYCFQVDYFEESIEVLLKVKDFLINKSSGYYPDLFFPAPFIYQVMLRHITSVQLEICAKPKIPTNLQKVLTKLQSSGYLDFNSAELAKICNVSISQFNRKFKHKMNLSPQKYWENYRFAHICIALENTNKNLTELAYDFSFADSACFTKWFRKHAGKTPSDWRKDVFNRQQD